MATINAIKAGTTTITATYGGVTSNGVSFTVNRINPTISFTKTSSTITYDGTRKAIGTVSYNGDGTAYYIVIQATSKPSTPSGSSTSGTGWVSVTDGGTVYATNSGVASGAGTYWVFLKSDQGTNYNAISPTYGDSKAISKATVNTTAPTIKSSPIQYTGSALTLLSGNGSVSPTASATIYYYVSTSASPAPTVTSGSEPGTGWSTTSPSKTAVGTYYVWYYSYISDTDNYAAGTNTSTVKSLGSIAIEQRSGAAPTFNNASVSATCVQSGAAVQAGAFTAATAGHGGAITYAIQNVVADGSSTPLSGWNLTSTTSRVISIPANTLPGTYLVTVRANEAATTTDTESYKDAVITVTLSKGTQTLTLTNNPSNATITYSNTGTITASGHAGTISATSATTSVATTSTSGSTVTVTSVGAGTSVITVTAAATDYVNAVSETVTWTVERATGAAPTFSNKTVTATITAITHGSKTTSAFTAATAGHGGTISYAIQSITLNGNTVSTSGWSINSSRKIVIPAQTIAGSYLVTVRANEAETAQYTSSYKDATITVTLSKANNPLAISTTELTLTVPNTGMIEATTYTGTLTVSSDSTSVATATNSASSTITAVGAGTATITFSATATDYEKSGSKTATVTVNRRTGADPTFAASSVTATCVQSGAAVNATTFTPATAGHGGTISYSVTGAVADGSSTQLSGWTVNDSGVITVPANTLPGTYKITVLATESETSTDSSSSKSAVITVTLSKGSQTLNLNKTTLSLTVPNTGTITASGYAGTLSVSSNKTDVATATNAATSTITAVGVGDTTSTTGSATITFTAAATDYVNSVSKTATVTVTRRTGADPTFANSTVTATCVQAQSARTTSAFSAGTAKHGGTLSYSLVSVTNSGGSALSNWSVNSSNRTISIPANTPSGTYTAVVKCTESQTSSDTSSSTNATITVTLSKGDQTLTLNKTTLTVTVGSTGTITASGYAGDLTVGSGTPAVATATNEATTTITGVKQGTSTITFTADANDYVNAVSKTATVTVNRRTGAAPSFSASTVSATCSQDQTAKTTSAFTAASPGHSGTISYSLVSAKNSGDTTLDGWSVNSSGRTINIPANTPSGTYTCVVRATEAQTDYDTSSTKDATITVNLSKGSQTLTLDKTELNLTVPNTGTIKATGYAGTLHVSSGTTTVATATNSATSTITAVSQGTSTITFTADANNYVNSVTKTATVNVSRRTGAAPTFNDSAVTATCSQDQTAKTTSAFTAATAGHGGTITYELISVKNSSNTSLSGWTLTSSTRKINIPANTKAGTYTAVVRANEDQTSTDSSSSADATITITLNKGTQSLTLTGNPTNFTSTYPNGGTITASGYAGSLSVSSGTQSVATVSNNNGVITVTCVGAGTSEITVTAAANDYVNAVTMKQNWTINKANSEIPTNWKGDSKVYHETATLTATGYSGGTLKYRYDVNNGTNWTETTTAPTRDTVGTTAVQCMVVGDANHNNSSWSNTVTLTVREASDARMEVTTTNRTYNGNSQVIANLTAGTMEGVSTYYLGYYKSTSAATAQNQITWGMADTSLSATTAGTYQIYYRFTPDASHDNSVDWSSNDHGHVGSVVISKASRSGAVSCNNTTYPNTVQASVSGNTESGTVTWGITNGTGKATISSTGLVTPTQAGTVTITATVAATDNYAAYTATSKTITISKATGSLTYNTYETASQYCTTMAVAKSATDSTFEAVTIASASGSTSTNGAITYTVSPSGWTVQASGTKVLPSVGTSAKTYNVSITATAASTSNYEEVSQTNTIAVTISSNTLNNLELVIATTTIPYGSQTEVTSLIATYDNGAIADVKNDSGTTYSTSTSGIVNISK